MNLLRIIILFHLLESLFSSTNFTKYDDSLIHLPSDFIKGTTIFVGESDILNLESTKNTVKQLQSIGAEWISLVPMLYQKNETSSIVIINNTANISSIHSFVDLVHSLGMKVLLKPIIVADNGKPSIYFEPQNKSLWFETYSNIMIKYANLSENIEIEAISIGVELTYLTFNKSNTHYFIKLINDIKSFYSFGNLTYSSLFLYEYERISWWNQLDWIGIDAYWNLTQYTSHQSIAVFEDIMSSWKHVLIDYLLNWYKNSGLIGKPIIFTEIGYPSSINGLSKPAEPPHRCSANGSLSNMTVQEIGYKGLFAMLSNQMEIMNINYTLINGIFLFWIDNPSTSDYYNESGKNGHNWNCWFTPRGKPAWDILKVAYNLRNDNSVKWYEYVIVGATIVVVLAMFFMVYRICDYMKHKRGRDMIKRLAQEQLVNN